MVRLPQSPEAWLILVIISICLILGIATDTFWTLANAFDLLNASAINVIFAVGLLVVLIAGGIDISFAVAASVVQYVTALAVIQIGGGNWPLALLIAALVGFGLGAINAGLIHYFRIISIVATIATFGAILGVILIAIAENGLNLLGVSPYAFKMVVGAVILIAITTSNLDTSGLLSRRQRM